MMGGWRDEWPTKPDVDAAKFTNTYGTDHIDIWGDVDFFGYVWGCGVGEEGGDSQFYIMPRKISWTLFRWDAGIADWVTVQEPDGSDFVRHVVDFGDIPLGGSDNWDEYKQLYFRFQPDTLFGETGRTYCLTNCSDAEDWDGINTIEENYWDTALEAEGLDPAYHPENMVTPDDLYKATVYAFNWEEDQADEFSIEFMLHNTKEIAQEVHLTDAVTDQDVWHAEWVAYYDTDGFTPEKNIYANITAQPGTTLDIEIIFSGPMSTVVDPYVRFTKPDGAFLTADPSSPEWTSTYLPDGYFDTWHGSVEIPVEEYSGWMTMKIKAKDISDIGLLDPSIEDPDPPSGPSDEEYTDDHHGFGIAFSSEEGWPVFLSHWVSGSPVLGDFDGDDDLDIAVQSNKGSVQLIDETGLVLRTLESGDWSGFNYLLHSSPAVADIDLDGDMDVLAVHPYGCNAWDAETGSDLPGWPVYMGSASIPGIYPSRSAPAVCDLIGDAHPEVVICRHLDLTSPNSVCTVWMYDYAGNYIWSRELEDGGVSVTSTPAVGDIASDAVHVGSEILVCTSDGFTSNYPYPPPDGGKDWNSALYLLDPLNEDVNIWKSPIFNCYFFASPVVGDIDGDGINEVIVGSHLGTQWKRVFVLDGDSGTLEHTFYVSGTVPNSAAICDLNGDGILDIVAVDNSGHVYCWSGEDFNGGSQYDPLPGFPVEVTGSPTSPSIADIDGDFKLEIVIGTGDGYLYAINHDGSICSGYPVTVPELSEITGQPVIANLDNDDSLELMFADGSDSYAYCYDLGVKSFPAEMPWRQFQHDSWHTGCFAVDNTIPEPPTNLTGEITYTAFGSCEVELEWDLSVNDPYSGSPQEPADVIWYGIMRAFPRGPFHIIGRVHAGTCSYVDCFTAGGSVVVYKVFAYDGTNESEYSNIVKLPTSPSAVISLGCSVIEEFSVERSSMRIPEITEHRITEESSHAEIASVHERTSATVPTATLDAVLSRGNPGCLTDGSTEVCYSPSPGADAVVIDLGEECTVTSVLPERVSGISIESAWIDESVRTVETARVVEPSLLIEVAGSDREFYRLTPGSRSSTDAVRYVRVCGASGLSEVSIYGSRSTEVGVSSVEITRSVADEGWMFAIPVMEYSEEAEVNIYDISGRMIWSGHAESGSVLYWDGYTGDRTPLPNGVYLLHCSIGSEVSTGSFVVRRD